LHYTSFYKVSPIFTADFGLFSLEKSKKIVKRESGANPEQTRYCKFYKSLNVTNAIVRRGE